MIADHILPLDTQAILLLCGYFGNNDKRQPKPLSLTEYNKLTLQLRSTGLRPRDLVEDSSESAIKMVCPGKFDAQRIKGLLKRGIEMGFAVEEWTRQGIWVISRADATYPRALKLRLREAAPSLLYGIGNQDLLDNGGLGVVGSRDADDEALRFTRAIASRCAQEKLTLVSGGARGVDREAMGAALFAGGSVLGILPEGIAKVAVTKTNREPIAAGQLTLVSPYHPGARWTGGNAMGRNKHIYAFSDWTLVVSSATQGGTWSGATECLKKGWGRLLVRTARNMPTGNAKLIQLGAVPFESATATNTNSFEQLLNGLFEETGVSRTGSATLFSAVEDNVNSNAKNNPPAVAEPAPKLETDLHPAPSLKPIDIDPENNDLFYIVWPYLKDIFSVERTVEDLSDIAKSQKIHLAQLKAWIKRAIEEGYLVKRSRPVRYIVNSK